MTHLKCHNNLKCGIGKIPFKNSCYQYTLHFWSHFLLFLSHQMSNWQLLLYCFFFLNKCSCFVVNHSCIPQSLAKLTVNFQSSLSISDSAGEVTNSIGIVGDACNLQQYCDTGCQTDIMGEVGDTAAPPCKAEVFFKLRGDGQRRWRMKLERWTTICVNSYVDRVITKSNGSTRICGQYF